MTASTDTVTTAEDAGTTDETMETKTKPNAESTTETAMATETTDEDDDSGAVELTRKPAVASSLVAVAAAVVATLVASTGSLNALAVGAVGTSVLGVGLVVAARTAVDVGAVFVFFGVVLGGLDAAVVGPTILGTIATVLAWDVAHTAIDLGEQLGRDARTLRLEAVTIVSSLFVGLVAGTVGYAVYVVGAGGQPVAAVVLLLVAAALITVGLGTQRQGSGSSRSRHMERSRRS